ncbi:hypothetical protein [Sulfurospirillum oryzae]|uniref:hypothetical protein n=1 Tax=Sulfurospirillum oryzae TaxID=2976535 RepID=UPI0021E771A4|nr:hypothetical protein [Sulfurospirillum oryzae]
MYHRFIVYLLACFGITQGYANEGNTTQKKEDIKATVLFQGKEAYDKHLKQKIDEKSSSVDVKKKEITPSNENNISDVFKMRTIKE